MLKGTARSRSPPKEWARRQRAPGADGFSHDGRGTRHLAWQRLKAATLLAKKITAQPQRLTAARALIEVRAHNGKAAISLQHSGFVFTPSINRFNKIITLVISFSFLAKSALLTKAAAFSKLFALTSLHVVSHFSRSKRFCLYERTRFSGIMAISGSANDACN